MPNALANETSPYLLQHQQNPVQWLPWGEPALALARSNERPLLVSIGYSSCHWCHVMERESFEDERVAQLMNEHFVCVKVDREERPDIDALYMEAVQSMTGQGGWPLTVFLTPEGVPFFGGTYYPPRPRQGMPSFSEVLIAVSQAWEQRAQEIRAESASIAGSLSGGAALKPLTGSIRAESIDEAVAELARTFDRRHGGFGGAPKFPQACVLELLIARASTGADGQEREIAQSTLAAMASGGIHDQLGGGFHRYAVDASWTVPHFEKMLYDNALLARAYAHAYELWHEEWMREACIDTLEFALREMCGPEGGFYAALDADSDGHEGLYYVWRCTDIEKALGGDAQSAIDWLGATDKGNFFDPHHPVAGLNVLSAKGNEPDYEQRTRIRAALLAERSERKRPLLDEKRVTSWNALMIAALADAGGVLGEERFLQAARKCAEFVLARVRAPEGGLARTYNAGRASIPAFLEDHAFMLEAMIALFERTCEERWLEQACALAQVIDERFSDPVNGGYFSSAANAERLIVRRKDLEDNPIPSGNSSAANGLLRLAQLTGEQRYEDNALGALALVRQIAVRHPHAFAHALQAMHWHVCPARPIACPLPARPGSSAMSG